MTPENARHLRDKHPGLFVCLRALHRIYTERRFSLSDSRYPVGDLSAIEIGGHSLKSSASTLRD